MNPSRPIVLVAQDVSDDLDPAVAGLATILSPAGLRPAPSGGLVGSLAPGGSGDGSYRFMPVIRNFADARAIDKATVAAIMANPALRREHVAQITNLTSYNRFAGIFIDYRELSGEQGADFASFISELAASFAEQGLLLGAVVPTEFGADGNWEDGGYDWRAIGAAVDYFQLRPVVDPRHFAPAGDGSVADLLQVASTRVERKKILLGVSVRSIREVAGVYSSIAWHGAFAALGDVIVTADEISETGSIEPGNVIRASLTGYRARIGFDEAYQTAYLDYIGELDERHRAGLAHRFQRIFATSAGYPALCYWRHRL